MSSMDCILDISNVYHTTSVLIERNCLSRSEPTAVLKDVSARVHGGEVLAILGSKGSGKRALLDIIGNTSSHKKHFQPTFTTILQLPQTAIPSIQLYILSHLRKKRLFTHARLKIFHFILFLLPLLNSFPNAFISNLIVQN